MGWSLQDACTAHMLAALVAPAVSCVGQPTGRDALMHASAYPCRQLVKLESWKRAEKRQIRAELRQLAKEERQRQQKAVQVC